MPIRVWKKRGASRFWVSYRQPQLDLVGVGDMGIVRLKGPQIGALLPMPFEPGLCKSPKNGRQRREPDDNAIPERRVSRRVL